ncbi:MAG: Synechococcus phage Syn19 [Pseudomonadota bacterium]|jgi:uncharacterized protein (TIGR02466 family)
MLKKIMPDFYFHTRLAAHEQLKNNLFPQALAHCRPTKEWNCEVQTTRESGEIDYSGFLTELKGVVSTLCDSIGTRCPLEFRIESLWMNVYNVGNWQELHHHASPNNNLSFCYFMNLNPQTDAHFFFQNERSANYSAAGLHQVFNLVENLEIAESTFLQVAEGDIILFPSHLRHGVSLQRANSNRCTLSGNLLVLSQT